MNSVIARVKEKYPQYAEVPDHELTLRIGAKYPQYLEVPDFKDDYDKFSGLAVTKQVVGAVGKAGQAMDLAAQAEQIPARDVKKGEWLKRQQVKAAEEGRKWENLTTALDWAGQVTEPYTGSGMLNQPARIMGQPDSVQPGQVMVPLEETGKQIGQIADELLGRTLGIGSVTGQGVGSAAGQIAQGFTTPEMAIAAPALAAKTLTVPFEIAKRGILGTFAGQMAMETPAAIQNAYDVARAPQSSPQERVAAAIHALALPAMSASIVKHATKPIPPIPPEIVSILPRTSEAATEAKGAAPIEPLPIAPKPAIHPLLAASQAVRDAASAVEASGAQPAANVAQALQQVRSAIQAARNAPEQVATGAMEAGKAAPERASAAMQERAKAALDAADEAVGIIEQSKQPTTKQAAVNALKSVATALEALSKAPIQQPPPQPEPKPTELDYGAGGEMPRYADIGAEVPVPNPKPAPEPTKSLDKPQVKVEGGGVTEKPSPESIAVGDKISWEPNESERRYQSAVSGIVQDVIHNAEGEIGFHIFSPTEGDPSRVVRVWANRGKVVSREPAKVESRSTPVSAPPVRPSDIGTPRRPKTVVEIADEIAARGVDPQNSYGQFVKARDLKPEISAKEWLPIYRQSLEIARLNKQLGGRTEQARKAESAPVQTPQPQPAPVTEPAKVKEHWQPEWIKKPIEQITPEEFYARDLLVHQRPEPSGKVLFDISGWTVSSKKQASRIRDAFVYSPEKTDQTIVEFPKGTRPWEAAIELANAIKEGDGPGESWLPIAHREAVMAALREGKPVPPEVLADYPDLQPKVSNEKVPIETPEAKPAAAAEALPRVETPGREGAIGKEGEVSLAAEPIGMGGAVPGEFKPSAGTATAIKNAAIEVDRAKLGLQPFEPVMRKSYGRAWDEAMAILDQRGPPVQDALIAELQAKPRSVTDVENALLQHRLVDLKNEYAKATRDLAQAFDDGRTFDVERLQGNVDFFVKQIETLTDVTKKVGTETGRGLAARKMFVADDFSILGLELQKRAAKGGEPLTADERAQIAELSRKVKETEKAFEEQAIKHQTKLAEVEAQRLIAEAKAAQAVGSTQYHPKVIEIAESILKPWKEKADAASQRIRERLSRVSAGVDPTIVSDVIIVGSYKVARGAVNFARWVLDMRADYGENLDPYLTEDIFNRSKAIADADLAAIGKKHGEQTGKQVRTILKNQTPEEINTDLTTKIEAKVRTGKLDEATPLIQRLVRHLVSENKNITRDQLVDKVHEIISSVDPSVTRREAMDAISGYGDYSQLSKDEVSLRVRDLKGQLQQVAKLEDIQAKQPLQKTGVERRTPSNEERKLIQQVEEAKRRFGVVVTDPATQLKSALDARKTYYKNRITDLEAQIASREKFIKQKTASPTDAELESLKAKAAQLRGEFDAIFGKPEMTDAQRVEIASRAIQKSIDEYERRIKEADLFPGKKPSKTPKTPELEALKARRDFLKGSLKEFQDAATPKKTPEEIALQSFKTRAMGAIADYQERLAKGDFSPRQKKVLDISKDPEAMRLKAENERLKMEFQKGLQEDKFKRMGSLRKTWEYGKEVFNIPRTILSSWDVSAVLRQGGFISMGNPVRAAKSVKTMFEALLSENKAREINQSILHRDNARNGLYAQSKLYLAPLDSSVLNYAEEMIASRFSDKIPGIRPSNRAYVTYLNKIRADSFDALKSSLERKGAPLNEAELKAIAAYINVATGRGTGQRVGEIGQALSALLFSPRLVASRFQLALGQPLIQGHLASPRVRNAIAKEYAKFLVGSGVVLSLGVMAGGEVETDPRSGLAGRIRFGDTVLDPLAGLAQVTTMLGRTGSVALNRLLDVFGQPNIKEAVGKGGKMWSISGEKVPFGKLDLYQEWSKFARTKFSPSFGTIWDLMLQRDVVGAKATPRTHFMDVKPFGETKLGQAIGSESTFPTPVPGKLVVPLSFQDILDVAEEHDIPKAVMMELLTLFGMGLQHYDNQKRR